MIKLDVERVKESGRKKEELPLMQVAIFAMCGGGMLGRSAAEQPADFYIDDRCGKLPYPKKEIYQAVATLKALAEVWGYDPKNLPEMPVFHNMGVLF